MYAIGCFNQSIQDVVSGQLTQERLSLLIARRKNLLALHKELRLKDFGDKELVPDAGISGVTPEQVLEKIIGWREAEAKAFRDTVKMIQDAKAFISTGSLGNNL